MTDREKLVDIMRDSKSIGYWWFEETIAEFADHLLANGVTVQQWTPVTERLPTREDANETESILAINKDDRFVGRWIWEIVARYPTAFTHWMPLPEPPKEDET